MHIYIYIYSVPTTSDTLKNTTINKKKVQKRFPEL